jgi:aminocarboxymuconate-semialdehyde decarboxylase
MKLDLHTHFYTEAFFQTIRDLPSEFSFGASSTGQTIITYRGARFFGVTPAMTDVAKRIEDMDRVGIDVEVVSLSTPNVFFADAAHQPAVAKMMNDSYAELIARHPKRFKGFASIPMDAPDAALNELHRAIDTLKLNGVILLSNIGGKPLTSPEYREYVLGPIIGFPFDTSLAVARMCYDGMFEELPDIRWIIGHLGGAIPYLMERMDNGFRDFADCRVKIDKLPSVYLKRLYYDTVSFSPHTLKMVRDMVGADHMAMGSDYPHLLGSIDRAVTSIEVLEEKETIFSRTALSILNNI